jgi:hypothetical protein
MGVKGGCSPQNNREATIILRIFRREVSKKHFETEKESACIPDRF